MRMRVNAGWPSNSIPNMSQVSRSCQSLAGYTATMEGMWQSSSGQVTSSRIVLPPLVVDRMQLAAGLMRVVHPRDAAAHLEAQRGVITQCLRDAHQMLTGHEDGHLTAVDHDPLNSLRIGRAPADEGTLQKLCDFVEVPAVRADSRSGEEHRSHEAAVPAGVSA